MIPFSNPLTVPAAGGLVAAHVNTTALAPPRLPVVESSESRDSRDPTDDKDHHGRKLAEGRLLGTLMPGSLRVTHRPGTGPGNHALWRLFDGKPFPLRRGCVVAFDVRFEQGFEWGCRGKIGGLKVGHGPAEGGRHNWHAATLRIMWDAGGGAHAYVYVPSGSERRQPAPLDTVRDKGAEVFKADFRSAFAGRGWHRVELGLKVNTFTRNKPNPDGKLVMSIDGKTRELGKIIWAMAPDHVVEAFTLGVFHGGGCRATRTSHSNYRNIRAYSWA